MTRYFITPVAKCTHSSKPVLLQYCRTMSSDTVDHKDIDFDPYEVLEVAFDAPKEVVEKAFKKKALKWHPDKNPDKKEYAENMFRRAQKAKLILCDKTARAALDQLRKAKEAAKARFNQLDAKRQKLRQDLEERERRAADQWSEQQAAQAQKQFDQQVERLRKQAAEELQRERERIDREVAEQSTSSAAAGQHTQDADDPTRRLRVTWSLAESADENVYTEDVLTTLFSKWGAVLHVVLAVKKKKQRGTAIVEFACSQHAATAAANELGFDSLPLSISYMGKADSKSTVASSKPKAEPVRPQSNSPHVRQPAAAAESSYCEDFESNILLKMKEAQEKRDSQAKRATNGSSQEQPVITL